MDAWNEQMLEKAVSAAASSDRVILFVGDTYGIEGEGYDRTTINLPRGQQELIRRIMEVNSEIILVVTAGSVVNITGFEPGVKAILMNYLGGEGWGSAVANVLYGLAEPGGRLPETWPLNIRHTPAWNNFPAYPDPQNEAVYGEGIYVGYRWYESRQLPVLYPFGFGLSYTEFSVSGFMLGAETIAVGEILKLSFKIKNIGTRRGSQVVQIYVRDIESSVDRPEKELKDFAKIELAPGEEKVLIRELDRKAFEFFSTNMNRWVVEDGDFEIMLGVSAAEILYTEKVRVRSSERVMIYDRFTPIQWFLEDEYLEQAAEDFPEEIRKGFKFSRGSVWGLLAAFPIYRLAYSGMLILPHGITMEGVDRLISRLNELHMKKD